MHAKKFYSEFLDIMKNDFRPEGAYAPMSQNGFLANYVFHFSLRCQTKEG
jgi:hypothetical protein